MHNTLLGYFVDQIFLEDGIKDWMKKGVGTSRLGLAIARALGD